MKKAILGLVTLLSLVGTIAVGQFMLTPSVQIGTQHPVMVVDDQASFGIRLGNGFDPAVHTVRAFFPDTSTEVTSQLAPIRQGFNGNYLTNFSQTLSSVGNAGLTVRVYRNSVWQAGDTETVDVINPYLEIDSPETLPQYITESTTVVDIDATLRDGDGYTLEDFVVVTELDGVDISADMSVAGTDIYDERTVGQGQHTLTFSVQDANGYELLSEERDFLIIEDADAPVLIVTAPEAGFVTSTPLVVSGSFEENYLDVLRINGTEYEATYVEDENGVSIVSTFEFSEDIAVSEGEQSIEVEVVDLAGNTASETIEIIADFTAPTLSVVAPADGSETGVASVLVEGIASDSYLSAVRVQGQEVAIASSGEFSAPVDLSEGENTIEVVAVDEAGLETVESIVVTADFTAPTLGVSSHADEEVVSSCSAVAYEASTDDDSASFSLRVRNPWNPDYAADNDGAGYIAEYSPVASSGVVSETVALVAGQNIVELRAEDSVGNETVEQVTLYCDEEGPLVSVREPLNGFAVYGTEATVDVEFDDALSSVDASSASWSAMVGGVDVTSSLTDSVTFSETGASGSISGLTEGDTVEFTFTVSDVLGNVGSATAAVYVASEIAEPVAAEGDGYILGTVYDMSTCDSYGENCAALAGVEVSVLASGEALAGTVVSGAEGAFAFPVSASGSYVVQAVADGYAMAMREVDVVLGQEAAAGGLYMNPVVSATLFEDIDGDGSFSTGDTALSEISDSGGSAEFSGTQANGTPWSAVIDVPAGAVDASEPVTELSIAWLEQEQALGEHLPEGTAFTYAFDIVGADSSASVEFTVPVEVRFSDTLGFPATFSDGSAVQMPVGYLNPETAAWEHAAVATGVDTDSDGTVDEWAFEVEHFSVYAPSFAINDPEGSKEDEDAADVLRPVCDPGSQLSQLDECIVDAFSGNSTASFTLPGEAYLDGESALTLQYNSGAARPAAVVASNMTVDSAALGEYSSYSWSAQVGGSQSQQVHTSASAADTYQSQFAFTAQNYVGEWLQSGVYSSQLQSRGFYNGEFYASSTGEFGGSADLSLATGVAAQGVALTTVEDTVAIQNLADSAFGAGWTLGGMQTLHETDEGELLVTEGNTLTQFELEEEVNEEASVIAVAGSLGNMVSLLDYETDADPELNRFDVDVGETPLDLIVTPDGLYVYVINRDDDTVSVIDTSTQQRADTNGDGTLDVNDDIEVGGYPYDIAVSPDGAYVYIANYYDYTISVIDTSTQQRVDTNGDGTVDDNDDIEVGDYPSSLAITPNGLYVFVTNYRDNSVSVIDASAYQRVDTNGDSTLDNNDDISVGYHPHKIAVAPDGSHIYVANFSDNSVSVIDSSTYQRVDTNGDGTVDNNDDIEVGSGPYDLAITSDGTSVYVANYSDNSVSAIDTSTYQRVDTNGDGTVDNNDEIHVGRVPVSIEVVPDGSYVYVANRDDDTVSVIDTSTYQRVDTNEDGRINYNDNIEVGNQPRYTEISPGGRYVYIVNVIDGTLSVIDTTTQQLADINGDGIVDYSDDISIGNSPGNIVISPDGAYLYVVDISADTVNIINTTFPHSSSIALAYLPSDVAINSNGDYVYVINGYSVGVIDTTTEQLLNVSVGWGPYQMAFTSDEENLYVTNEYADTVSVIDTLTHQRIDRDGNSRINNNDDIEVGDRPKAIIMTLDGLYAFVGNYGDDTVSVIDTLTYQRVDTNGDGITDDNDDIPVGNGPGDLVITSDGAYIYTANNYSDTVSVIDTSTFQRVDTNGDGIADDNDDIEVGDYPSDLVITPDGSYLYVTNRDDDTVSVIDTSTFQRVDTNGDGIADDNDDIEVGDYPSDLVITPDGSYAYITNYRDDTVSVIDTSTQQRFDANGDGTVDDNDDIDVGNEPSDIAITPDGAYVYVTNYWDGTVSVISVEQQQVFGLESLGGRPNSIAIQGSYSGVEYSVQTLTAADQSTLDYDAGSDTYTRIYPDGTQVHFNTDGTHDYTEDKNGNRTSYTYNADGTVATLTQTPASETAAALTWTFNYTNGELSSIQNPSGVTTLATVEDGQLTELENADGYSHEFSYDNENLLLSETLENGDTRSFRYDELGKVEALIQPTREVVDASGNVTTSQEVVQYEPASTAAAINSSDVSVSTTRSAPAQATSESSIVATTTYPGSNAVQRTFNQYGAPTSTTDALGRTTTYTYDSENNLQQISYPEGNAVSYTYNDDGYPTSVTQLATSTDTAGLTTTYTYEDSYNQVKTATDANGNTTTYFYDYEFDTDGDGGFDSDDDEYSTYEAAYASQGSAFAGNVWKVEQPETDVYSTSSFTSTAQTPTLYFTWNANGQLLTAVDQDGATTAQTYGAGRSVRESVSLDSTGENFTTTFANFNSFGKPESVTDARGNTRSLSYNAHDGLPTGETVTVDIDQDGTQESITEWRAYNSLNQLATTVHDSGGADQLTEQATRLHDGQPIYEVQFDSNNYTTYTTITYDELRRPALVTDANGDNIFYQYDAEGQLTSMVQGWTSANAAGEYQESYAYDNNGNRTAVTYTDGTQDLFTYDSYGRLSSEIRNYVETDPTEDQNITRSFSYDDAGNVTSVTAPDGVVTQYTYDERGNVRSAVEDYGGLNLTTTYSYDAKGQQVLEEDMKGVLTLREYNALGWLAEETQDFTVDASGLNLSTTYTYDENGNATLMVDPRGVQTQRVYDERNQLVREVEDYSGENAETVMTHDRLGQLAQTTDPTGMVTVSDINGFGWLLAETIDSGQEDIWSGFAYDAVGNNIVRADDNNNVTAYSYDALGRLEETLFADGTYENATYDARGWVDVFTQRDGSTVQHYYDGLGRTLNRTYSDGGHRNFTYDAVGRVLTAEDVGEGVEETRTYSALGDIETSVQDVGAVSGTVAYSYDYTGGTVDITYPSGEVITRSLDSLGRLDTVQNSAGETVADIDIDDIAGTVSRTFLNGASQVSTLDALRRVESVVSRSTAGTIADYNYTYDAAGNRTAVEKAHLGGTNVYDTYRLNTAHMITGVKYRADSAEYGSVGAFGTYRTFDIDGLGNRTDIDVNGTTYNYGPSDGSASTDPLNRYTQAGGWSLTYDDNGRVTDDGRNSYTWNDAGRLESGTGMYGESFTYTYDAFDRRVATDVDGTETFFFYDANENVLEEQDSSGALQRQYVYGEGMDIPLQLVDAMSGETYYYHTDALGSVTELTDSSGSVAESYEYDVYGDVTIYEDSAGGSEIDFGEGTMQPYLFAARRYDPETENYYNRARYYSPDLGRFLSPDPLGYHDSMNTYQYALNNPMLYTDPTGEFGIKDIGRSVQAVVYGVELSFALFRNRDTLHYEIQQGTDKLTDLAQDIHANKNQNNNVLSDEQEAEKNGTRMNSFESSYHNHALDDNPTKNNKYVSNDGHSENVFDENGELVTSPENMGTYNYCSPYEDPLCHIAIDVIPYIFWGNTPEDSTNMFQRIFAPIINTQFINNF